MAPRRKWIDRKLLKELCESQCSNEEIAGAVRVSWNTLVRRYGEIIKIWRARGPMSVRRELYRTAMGSEKDKVKGNVTAMIFYLKNYGGMSDVVRNQEGVTAPVENIGTKDSTPTKTAGTPSLVQ